MAHAHALLHERLPARVGGLAGAPGGVDHDDSVNQRQLHSQLHRGWQDTKELWALSHGETAPPIDLAGVTYRGEPPDWWFHSDPSAIFRVRDGFLSEAEVEAALEVYGTRPTSEGGRTAVWTWCAR